MRCISKVRICSSTGLPCGPITVVCSDWYMLNFGIATKSLKRPGTGCQWACMMPSAAYTSRTDSTRIRMPTRSQMSVKSRPRTIIFW